MTSAATELHPLDCAFTATDLMRRVYPPLEYVVPGVIPEGLTVLVAPPKIGKSWMVLGIAKASSEGSKALGAINVGQRPVLYLALEDGPRRLQDRLLALGMTEGNDHLSFMTETPAGAALTIGAFVEQHHDRSPVVILDTLGMVRTVYSGNDAYQKDYAEMSAYKQIVGAHPGSALIVVHHTNKGAHNDFVASTSGTQGIAGAADSILTIERGRGHSEAVLNVTSRDAAEGTYAISLDEGQWRLEGESLAEASTAVDQRKASDGVGEEMRHLLDLVGEHPEGIKPKDVAVLLGWDPSKARLYLKRAYEGNRIRRLERGLYAPLRTVTSETTETIQPEMDLVVTEDTQVTRLHDAKFAFRKGATNGRQP